MVGSNELQTKSKTDGFAWSLLPLSYDGNRVYARMEGGRCVDVAQESVQDGLVDFPPADRLLMRVVAILFARC